MKNLLLFFSAMITLVSAQENKDLIIMAVKDSVCLFITVPPRTTEGYNVYRKGPIPSEQNYVLLNNEGPITAVIDPAKAQEIIGDDWENVLTAVRSDDPYDALRKLRRDDFSGGLVSLIYPSVAKATGRMFVDHSAVAGNEYEYKIETVNSSGKVLDSLIKRTIISPVFPIPPEGLKAEEHDEYLKLSWTYPLWKNDLNNLAVKYYIYRQQGKEAFQKINTGLILRDDQNKPEFTDVWLQNGLDYSYYVTAVDPIGRESKPSQVIHAVPKDKIAPGIPEILSIKTSGKKVILNWKISLESDAAGYNVFRSTTLDKQYKQLNKTLIPVTQTTLADSAIRTGVQYFYTVSAVDKNKNESSQSNARNIIAADIDKPDPPAGPVFKLNNKFVSLTWKNSKTKDIAGYYVYRGSSEQDQVRISSGVISNTFFNDTIFAAAGLQPGTIYYSVASVDSAFNESEKLFLKVVIPDIYPPDPPNNFFVENFEGRFIKINAGVSTAGDTRYYKIYRSEPGQKFVAISPGKTISDMLFDSAIVKGKSYFYYSTSVDTAGNESIASNTDTVFFRDYAPPPQVVNLIINQTADGIVLEWDPVIDFDMSGYFVLRSEVPNGIYERLNTVPLQERKYTDRPIEKNKYYYKVAAVDTSGNLSDTDEFVFVP